nr:GH25 family lysozyme [Wolbachia endosymbiont (group A) of Ectemnius continuus]
MIKNVIVDLSHWNQSVNFKLVKEDGILGIIHKATQGLKYVDGEYAKREKPLRKKEFSGEHTILV